MFVGPTAESTLRDLRADKLFLSASGVTLDFGLSHSNISEVTIKKTMIESAHQVILLVDHTCFGQEATTKVAPLGVVDKLITNDALSASIRLELSELGIEVILTSV
jgi:DeoR/GlpR family transcriptional regulator of sugar metabolism